MTPGPLVVAVVSGPAGKTAARVGFRKVLLVGFAVFVAGLVWYATRVGLNHDYLLDWLPGTLITGLGIGLTFPVLSAAAVSSLHQERFAVGQRGEPDGASGRRRVRYRAPRGHPRHAARPG